LLLKHKARVDSCGAFGRTALMGACLAGNAEVAQALLDAGANPDLADAHGVTPLMEAARAGANAVLRLLAPRQHSAAAIDACGRNALLIACQSAQADSETIALLVAMGVDATLRDSDGRNALERAIAGG